MASGDSSWRNHCASCAALPIISYYFISLPTIAYRCLSLVTVFLVLSLPLGIGPILMVDHQPRDKTFERGRRYSKTGICFQGRSPNIFSTISPVHSKPLQHTLCYIYLSSSQVNLYLRWLHTWELVGGWGNCKTYVAFIMSLTCTGWLSCVSRVTTGSMCSSLKFKKKVKIFTAIVTTWRGRLGGDLISICKK